VVDNEGIGEVAWCPGIPFWPKNRGLFPVLKTMWHRNIGGKGDWLIFLKEKCACPFFALLDIFLT